MSVSVKNKKLFKKKKNISFKSYIKTIYNDVTPLLEKKRRKVLQDNFKILQFSEYQNMLKHNYNVQQLKQICKFYKQKSSGNKKELMNNCYNYLKLSHKALIIQTCFRGHIVRHLNKLKGPACVNRKCTNETDFFTLVPLKEIPKKQFFSYKDKDDFIYGFDICSLYNMIVVEKMDRINPYNRNELPKNILKTLQSICHISNILGDKLNIKIDNTINNLSQEKKLELKAIELFQKIDDLGFITNANWIVSLSRVRLRNYLNELYDIWNYRAQLSNETKRKIDPINGNPFAGIHMGYIVSQGKNTILHNILKIIETFISRGETQDAKSLGVYYVLGALTMVSFDAANSLPWLYDSFALF